MLNGPKAGQSPLAMQADCEAPNKSRAETYRQHLDLVVEDVAGKLERKAKQIRTVSGMVPKDITQEQFDSMLALICNMR